MVSVVVEIVRLRLVTSQGPPYPSQFASVCATLANLRAAHKKNTLLFAVEWRWT